MVTRGSAAQLLAWNPDVVVFSDDFFDRPGHPSEETIKGALTGAGFVERFVVARPAPGNLLVAFLASGLSIDPVFSNVGKVSPSLSIWVRGGTAFERHPTWTADGRALLFSRERDGTQAVFRASDRPSTGPTQYEISVVPGDGPPPDYVYARRSSSLGQGTAVASFPESGAVLWRVRPGAGSP